MPSETSKFIVWKVIKFRTQPGTNSHLKSCSSSTLDHFNFGGWLQSKEQKSTAMMAVTSTPVLLPERWQSNRYRSTKNTSTNLIPALMQRREYLIRLSSSCWSPSKSEPNWIQTLSEHRVRMRRTMWQTQNCGRFHIIQMGRLILHFRNCHDRNKTSLAFRRNMNKVLRCQSVFLILEAEWRWIWNEQVREHFKVCNMCVCVS